VCRRILAEHLAGERDRYEAVYRMRHKSGHWVWILARGKAYEWDADGHPLRMAGTHTDVTVRQLTTEALRLRERTLKAVLEALPIGVWIADANGRITSANPAALAIGPGVRYRALAEDGKRSEDAWGEDGRTVPPHDWALARAIQRREKIGEQLVEVEFADGSKKTVLNSGAPILDEEGKPLGAIAVNQDMTQWLQLEQDLLRRTYQLEESNRELEQFAYVASHDLQEPLRKVSSFAQLFAKKYAGHLDEAGQTYINFMVDGASRMQILVDDLLHYSRLTRVDQTHQEVDMETVLDGVLADLQLFIKESGARIEASPLPVIQGDTSQLRALLQNLVSNAVKYRAPDRSPEVHIGASVQAEEATFWVRDNGIGIDPRYFEKIFVIFQRLHTRTEYPGTGIGLAICKKIVDNHGGRIWVESSPGQGATFFFTLPTGEARK
ncbi:MAG: sensor histidine kinase, partial [Actinomycetota bacterium]